MTKSKLKIKIMPIIALILIGICTYAHAKNAEPVMRADVTRRAITIGDHTIYSITVRAPKGLGIRLPSFAPNNKIGIFEVKDHGVSVKNGLFGMKTITGWYDLTAYSTGKVEIPSVGVKYGSGSDKELKTAKTEAISITIQSVLPKNTTINDIKDIKGPLSYFEINFFLVIGILGLMGVCALLIYFRRKMQRGPVKLPHETALEELEAIRASLLQAGDVKAFYVHISDCIRYYIERSFAVKASEMTTEEFLDSLKTSPALTMEQKDLLKIFLSACDLVKFAKYSPTAQEIERVFVSAQKFIEETRPKKET